MTAIAEHGQSVAAGRTVTMAGALNQALRDALTEDASVLVFGEDVGTLGGVFRVTDGLAAAFGESRVFDTPLAESGCRWSSGSLMAAASAAWSTTATHPRCTTPTLPGCGW